LLSLVLLFLGEPEGIKPEAFSKKTDQFKASIGGGASKQKPFSRSQLLYDNIREPDWDGYIFVIGK
jgi:hypothetical protein